MSATVQAVAIVLVMVAALLVCGVVMALDSQSVRRLLRGRR